MCSSDLLLVDDDPQARALIEMSLADAHFERVLEVVTTASQGLKRIAADQHDVYLIDQRLPDGTGIDLIRDAKSSGATKPFILLTGFGSGALDEAALRELARVLKPGGVFAATVPSWFPEKINWMLSEEYHAPFVPGGHVRIYKADELRDKIAAVGLRVGDSHRSHGLHSPYWWLRCAVGPAREDHPLVKPYKKLLEWDIMRAPLVTRALDNLLSQIGRAHV